MTGRVRGGPRHAPRIPFTALVLALLGGGTALLLALNTASAANELARHDLAARDAGVAVQVQQLHVDVAASAASDKLGQAATAYGMVPAMNPAFIMVGADGTLRVLGSPAPVAGPPAVAVPKAKVARPSPAPARTTSSKAPAVSAASTPRAPGRRTGRATPGRATPARAARPALPASPRASPPASPSVPTPTPTPTMTLPGGTR